MQPILEERHKLATKALVDLPHFGTELQLLRAIGVI